MSISPYVSKMRAHIGRDLLLLPGVVAVVRDGGGRILLLRRRDNGRWALPAGMIEPGEQPADAIVREIHEETGVIAEVERLAGVGTHVSVYPNGDRCEYLAVWFRCRAVGGIPRPDGDEAVEVAFFEPADLPAGLGERDRLRIATTASPDGQAWYAPPAGRTAAEVQQ